MMLVRVLDQATSFLQLIERYGLIPGARVQVISRDEHADAVHIKPFESEPVSLGFRAASKIQVAPAD
jgi:Fe2+ transport system protein FeoA